MELVPQAELQPRGERSSVDFASVAVAMRTLVNSEPGRFSTDQIDSFNRVADEALEELTAPERLEALKRSQNILAKKEEK